MKLGREVCELRFQAGYRVRVTADVALDFLAAL